MAQNENTNDQNTVVDIEALYTNIIQEIDKYRSFVSVINNAGLLKLFINALSNGNTQEAFAWGAQVKIDTTAQESRCHTFYRVIGLPVVSPEAGGGLYNPGYDLENGFDDDVLKKHYQIIQAINKKDGLFALMDEREKNVNAFTKIFSLSNLNNKIANIDASVLLLSSVTGGTVRRFGSSLENSEEPFDTVIANQSYTVSGEYSNSINSAKLTQYKDSSGQVSSLFANPSNNLLNKRAHLLKPFMVDPRIDLTVNPPKGIICAPFVANESKTYVEGIVLNRPFLELVCRKRFNKDNQQINDKGVAERYQNLVDYVKSTDQAVDQTLLDKITKGVTQTVEAQIFLYNINVILAMIDKLHDSIQKINETDSKYHWIPIPDPAGPEINIGTQDVKIFSTTDPATGLTTGSIDPLITEAERQIVNLTASIELSNVNSENKPVDLGNFAFQGVEPIPDPTVTEGLGTRSQKHLDELLSQREESTTNAAGALRTIEIIMGEFSGLGLCDIIAIYTALWTVDKEVLVNMLDDEAFARMYQDPTLRDDAVETRNASNGRTLSGTQVLQKFEDKIKEIYALMDKLLQDRFGR